MKIRSSIKIIVLISFIALNVIGEMYCDTVLSDNDTIVKCKVYDAKGNLHRIKHYRNGKLDGIQEEYYASGKLKQRTIYNDGCEIDSLVSYHENGKLECVIYYSNCKCNGEVLVFDENGDTVQHGMCKNGKTIGILQNWYKKGRKSSYFTYNDSSKKDGLSVRWREDGTVQDSVIYRNGEMIEGWYYYDNGKLHHHLKKKGNDQYYSLVFYDPKGKKCGEVKNGNGTYLFYQTDGSSPAKVTKENGWSVSIEEVDPVTLKVIDPTKTPEAIRKRIADSLGLKAMEAIKNDNVDSIKSLIKSGFDINTVFRDPEYFEADITMLHFAALLRKEKVARFLMENGADPNIYENQSRLIAAEVALECRYDFDFVKIFLERVDMSKGGPIGFMKNVLRADSLRLFKYMVDKGFEPYEISDEEINVFQIAAFNGSVKCLKYLFTIRDVPEFKEEDGFSIYHCAAFSKKNGVETIKLLVENGVSTSYICQRDKSNSFTPYDYAVRHASRCSSYETQKREQYLKTAAYLKELQKKYCGIKDTNEKR